MLQGSVLPPAETEEQYDAVSRDETRLRPGVAALCARLGLGVEPGERFADGSLPVYAVGERRVLKLYPPVHGAERELESSVLQAIEGRLPVPTPRVERVGEVDGWGYLLMDRLAGRSLKEVLPQTTARQRERLADELGQAIAALHAVTPPVLEPADWDRFVAEQRASAVQRQRSRGLGEAWLEQIPEFLDSLVLNPGPPVLLHTEIMAEHLLVQPDGADWTLSGLFDFEPAMRGAAEYEFVAVGLFLTRGDPGFLRRLLTAYGYAPGQLDGDLPRRLLGYTLLHVYSNLPWYLREMPTPPDPTLDSLSAHWWRLS